MTDIVETAYELLLYIEMYIVNTPRIKGGYLRALKLVAFRHVAGFWVPQEK